MVLDRILARTREDLARRIHATPLHRLRAEVSPSERGFSAALRRPRTGFVMECKRASPSEGLICSDYDPAAVARAYAVRADAISVLTDAAFFQGSHQHLRAVRAAVHLPILCKTFVIDPYQVFEARASGADCVLLMLSVLDEAGYRACTAAAREAGIETLTEVHTAEELDRALRWNAPLIGINNRNLKTLRVDLGTTKRLAPLVPSDRVVLCESGIGSHTEARDLRGAVDGFLVGTSLMRAPDLPRAVSALVHGEVKVCGLTRPQDAAAAWQAGAVFGGLVFAPESPRRVTEDEARAVRDAASLAWVGVFVNESPACIADLAQRLGLHAVQLHGEESAAAVRALRPLLPPGCAIWKALRVRDCVPLVDETGADRLLLDTWQPDRRGGTGERFDWGILHSHPDKHRLILSGGLTPESAGDADALGVAALDVNSGVEERPGIKSPARLAAFFAALRGPGRKA
jgi:indole-3-glycerol phosphate synthase/phosphoribosylanthranilate isomerase